MSFPQLLANASVETSAQATTVAQTATPADPIGFQTALLVIIAGSLVFFAKHIAGLNNRLASLEAGHSPAKRPGSAAAHGASPSVHSGGITPEVIAAITAAVHTTLKGRARILSVGQVCPNRQAWSAEGRRQVFSSHKVR